MSVQDSVRLAAELGNALSGLGVVTDSQWQQALNRAGGDTQLPTALDILTRTPAAWAKSEDAGGVRSSALTAHQIKQINRCLSEDAISRLHRALKWNGYYILDPIGKGGMGVVYKGWDVEQKRFVAIKRTHRESPEVAKRLRREAKLQLSLEHSNIAKLFSLEKYFKTELLIMEYLPGNTLSEVLQKRGRDKPLPWPFVAEMAALMCDALGHAHGNNPRSVTVVHRDIKPGNIMLMRQKTAGGEKYVPKLLDMGLAKSMVDESGGQDAATVDEPLTRQFQILGTPEYMAPEQWEGGLAALPESDIYCLGGTLVYALTGKVPFPGVNKGNKMTYFAEMCHKHSADPRPSVRATRPDVPPEFDRLLQQMMAVAPSHRGTPARLRDQFNALIASQSGVRPSPSKSGKINPKSAIMPPSGSYPKEPVARSSHPSGSDDESAFGPIGGHDNDPPSSPSRAGMSARTPVAPRHIDDIDDSDMEVVSTARKTASERIDDDDDDDDVDSGPSRRRRTSVGIGGRAKKLFDPSHAGERTRKELFERVGDWFRGTIRPDRHPVQFVIVLAAIVGIGFGYSWGLAAFVAVLLGLAVGFAYAALGRPDGD